MTLWLRWCCNAALEDAVELRSREVTDQAEVRTGLPVGFEVAEASRTEVVVLKSPVSTVRAVEAALVQKVPDAVPPGGGPPTLLPRLAGQAFVPEVAEKPGVLWDCNPEAQVEQLVEAPLKLGRSEGKLGLATRSRHTASTGAATEDLLSETEAFSGAESALTSALCSRRGTIASLSVPSTAEAELERDDPLILYPWEVDEAVAQAVQMDSGNEAVGDIGEASSSALERKQLRTKMFHVDIERREAVTPGPLGVLCSLGLDTRPLVSDVTGALAVERVRPGGLIDEWNRARRKDGQRCRVRRGDFIVEVNGVRGSSAGLYKVIQQEPTLRLVIMRLPDGDKFLTSQGAGRIAEALEVQDSRFPHELEEEC